MESSLKYPACRSYRQLHGTEIQKCIYCLCHARSGCWSRFNCAKYSVSLDYWKAAGALLVSSDDTPETNDSYRKSMSDENGIVATIAQYTQAVTIDCNCDGKFDCKDMFAIHLFGERCANPNFGETYARRFNHCAASIGVSEMLPEKGSGNLSTISA